LRELKAASLNVNAVPPWNLPVPGFVKTWIVPKPMRSNSAENGFWLMTISRIVCLSGSPLDAVNPSTKT
jgi:hypothetical protein